MGPQAASAATTPLSRYCAAATAGIAANADQAASALLQFYTFAPGQAIDSLNYLYGVCPDAGNALLGATLSKQLQLGMKIAGDLRTKYPDTAHRFSIEIDGILAGGGATA